MRAARSNNRLRCSPLLVPAAADFELELGVVELWPVAASTIAPETVAAITIAAKTDALTPTRLRTIDREPLDRHMSPQR